jgi:glyoxylase-like metal-dependent hydrolase (beta-lactamase superfamily II)
MFKTITVVLAIANAASAQLPVAKDIVHKEAGPNELTAQFVKTGLFLISGGGCNTLLRLSGNGLILVDGKLPGNYQALLRQAGKLSFSDQPVRALINTNHQENHTGSNAKFLAAGTQIVGQENVSRNMTAAGSSMPPPTIVYDREYTIRMGGIEAQLFHFGNARTNADTVVYFPNLKVVAVGDLFSAMPDPDYAAGGSLVEWSPVLAQIFKLDFDIVVPGNGPMVSRADLERFKNKVDTLVSRATALVNKGVAEDQLMSRLNTEDLDWRLNFTGDRLHRFYAELSRNK